MADPDNSALDDARKRARRRLMGAVVLALAAAVALPMFLESDPRPLGPDVRIQIPAIDDAKFQNRLTPVGASGAPAADKVAPSEPAKEPHEANSAGAVAAPAVTETAAANKTEPSAMVPAPVMASKPVESKSTDPSAAGAAPPPARSQQKSVPPANPGGATPPTAPSPAVTMPAATPARKSAPPVAAPAPASTAALPAFSLTATIPAPGATPAPPAAPAVAQGAFVVQLGAFVDSAVAKDLAAKAGEQGFAAFLEAVTTKSGQVQRVRVGPFATRGEADAAAGKLKAAGFSAVARPR